MISLNLFRKYSEVAEAKQTMMYVLYFISHNLKHQE